MQTTLQYGVVKPMNGIEKAVAMHDGSPSKLAAAIGGGVRRQHVEHWIKTGRVSAEKTPNVHRATGIPCSELNDKVEWLLVGQKDAKPKKEVA